MPIVAGFVGQAGSLRRIGNPPASGYLAPPISRGGCPKSGCGSAALPGQNGILRRANPPNAPPRPLPRPLLLPRVARLHVLLQPPKLLFDHPVRPGYSSAPQNNPLTSLSVEFSQPFQSPGSLRPARPIFVCYTGIGRYPSVAMLFASMPSLPDRADPRRPVPTLPGSRIQLILKEVRIATIRVTHLTKKPLPMRHPISTQPRNQMKTSILKPHFYNFHIPATCVARAGCLTALPGESAAQIVLRPLVRRRTPAVPSAASHPPPKRVSMWHRHVGQSPLSTRLTARRSQK